MKLLTESNFKTAKSIKFGYLTGIMHLAPANLSGHNICSSASKGCIKACLNTAGRGKMTSVQEARIRKTKFFFEKRIVFVNQLKAEILALIRKAKKKQLKTAIRLNGTSDLQWETITPEIFEEFPNNQFYDYTKHHKRMLKYLRGELPDNYHLTFSRSENNNEKSLDVLRGGGNVAVVFKNLPEKWNRFKVYNADEHDLRFLDPGGVAGLIAKGRGKKDETGFVI